MSPPDSTTARSQAAQALVVQGSNLAAEGRIEEAIVAFDEAVKGYPAHAIAQLHAGTARLNRRQWARGVAHLRVAVAADPALAQGWANLALGAREIGKLDEARAAIERAVALDPSIPDAWNTRGLVMQDQGQVAEAGASFERAAALDPHFAIAVMNLANGQWNLGDVAGAERNYRRALAIDPEEPEVHYNLAHLCHKDGRLDEAIAHYACALDRRPDYHLARNNLAFASFLKGDFDTAWREYRARDPRVEHEAALAAKGRRYELPAPASLAGRTILVLAEQGLGDIVFFLRFAPALRALGAALEFAGEPRLHPILARTGLFQAFHARATDAPGPGERLEVLAGDLPLLAGDPARAPKPLALDAEPAAAASIRARLAALGPAPYIGLAWRSGIARIERQITLYKAVPIDALGQALARAGGTLVSVQREPATGELEALAQASGRPVHDLSDVNEDLEAALATMGALDEYVGVSSTNVHLRVGCGAGGRILVPFPPDWRWMASGDASPWFPDCTLYRQAKDREWRGALARLADDLARQP